MAKWQTIDSAPKDGTEFDGWSDTGKRVTDAFWGKRSWADTKTGWCVEGDDGWPHAVDQTGWCVKGDDGWSHAVDLTHWMPLPEAPE